MKILVITAGLSEPSSTALLGDQLAEATASSLTGFGIEAEFETVQLRSLAKDITNHTLTGFPVGKLAVALDQVAGADAIIAVTPTFKASYTGLFKSFWDIVDDDAVVGKPVLLAATGGTARHSLMVDTALRPLFGYLKAQVVPTGVFAATDDFGADTLLQSRVDRASAELAQMLVWKAGVATGGTFGANIPIVTENLDEKMSVPKKVSGLKELSVTPFADLLNEI